MRCCQYGFTPQKPETPMDSCSLSVLSPIASRMSGMVVAPMAGDDAVGVAMWLKAAVGCQEALVGQAYAGFHAAYK